MRPSRAPAFGRGGDSGPVERPSAGQRGPGSQKPDPWGRTSQLRGPPSRWRPPPRPRSRAGGSSRPGTRGESRARRERRRGPGRGCVKPPSPPQLTEPSAAVAPPTRSNEPLQRARRHKAGAARTRRFRAARRGAGPRGRGARGGRDFKASRPDAAEGWRSPRGRGLELRAPHRHPGTPAVFTPAATLGLRPPVTRRARPSQPPGPGARSPNPRLVRPAAGLRGLAAPEQLFSNGSPAAPPTLKSKSVVASLMLPVVGVGAQASPGAGPRRAPSGGSPSARPPPGSPPQPGGSPRRALLGRRGPASEAGPHPHLKEGAAEKGEGARGAGWGTCLKGRVRG